MKLTIIFCSTLLLVSCNKYLDKAGDPTKKIPSTIADVQLLLDRPLKTGSIFVNADEYFIPSNNWSMFSPIEVNYYLTWNANFNLTHITPEFWRAPYLGVFNANLSIELLNDIPVNAQNKGEWDHAMGSAYFFRAWSLQTIAWEFSKAWHEERSKTDPGAVLDLSSDFGEKLSRSTVSETYNQIIKDAEESIKYLPLYPTHTIRPSKLAAYGLLARTYLSMRKYDKALEQCNLYLAELKSLMNFNDPTEVRLTTDAPMKLFNKEVIFHNTPAAGGLLVPFFLRVDTTIYTAYHSQDLRKTAYFKGFGGYHQFKGSYTGTFEVMTGICTDEMYITRAECYARQGEIDKAMKDLNDLLITRWKANEFIPFSAATKDEAMSIILSERKKELLFRGLRWMDIKRLNEEGANISIIRKSGDKSQTGTLSPGSPRFAMQLPDEIVTNFGYQQNPIE